MTDERLEEIGRWMPKGNTVTSIYALELLSEVKRLRAAEEAAFRQGYRRGWDGIYDLSEAWTDYKTNKQKP